MLIRRAERFKASDVIDETLYLNRREFIAGGAAAVALGAYDVADAAAPPAGAPLKAERNEALSVKDAATKLESATTYNNFYEFGVNKDDPAREAHRLKTRPWTVKVEGLVHKPKTYDIDDLVRAFTLEERVYALRCVEAWSMVIPWIGVPVSEQPKTAWEKAAAQEYGFYSNVNPNVSHPRWSQATERRIGEFRRRPTLMFNGYADQVGSLYTGMDLKKYY